MLRADIVSRLVAASRHTFARKSCTNRRWFSQFAPLHALASNYSHAVVGRAPVVSENAARTFTCKSVTLGTLLLSPGSSHLKN